MSKTFTQEEVNKIVSDRLAGVNNKHTKEMEKFKTELGTLGFENFDQVKTLASERDSYKEKYEGLATANEANAKKQTILDLGVDKDFVDYVYATAPEGEFEKFITDNPRFKSESFTKGGSNPPYSGAIPRKPETATSDAEYLELRRAEEKNKN